MKTSLQAKIYLLGWLDYSHCTKMKFFFKNFFSRCDQIGSLLWIWSHLLNKSLTKNFIFCAVSIGHILLSDICILNSKTESVPSETIHLVHSQNFPKNKHFLPPGTHPYLCVTGGNKC